MSFVVLDDGSVVHVRQFGFVERNDVQAVCWYISVIVTLPVPLPFDGSAETSILCTFVSNYCIIHFLSRNLNSIRFFNYVIDVQI